MAEDEKGPYPANDNGSPSGELIDPRIRRIAEAIGRQLAARRASLRPPPTIMNDSDDSHVENDFPKAGLLF